MSFGVGIQAREPSPKNVGASSIRVLEWVSRVFVSGEVGEDRHLSRFPNSEGPNSHYRVYLVRNPTGEKSERPTLTSNTN